MAPPKGKKFSVNIDLLHPGIFVAEASPAGCFSVHCSTLEAGRTFWWLLLSTATSAFAAASAMNPASAQNIHPRASQASVAIKWGFPKPYIHATKEIGHFQGISCQKSPPGAAQHPAVGAQTQSSVWVPVSVSLMEALLVQPVPPGRQIVSSWRLRLY